MRSSTKRMLFPLAVCEGAGRPTGVAQDDPSRICCNTDRNLTRTSQVNSIGRLCCLTDKLSTIHSPTGSTIFFFFFHKQTMIEQRTGSCLCGKITLKIHGPALSANLCYCTNCQKSLGSVVASFATFAADASCPSPHHHPTPNPNPDHPSPSARFVLWF